MTGLTAGGSPLLGRLALVLAFGFALWTPSATAFEPSEQNPPESEKVQEGRKEEADEILGAPSAFGAEVAKSARVEVAEGASLLARARPGATVLAIVDAASELPEIERRGDWVRVRYRDLRGWVWTGDGPPRRVRSGDAPDDQAAGEPTADARPPGEDRDAAMGGAGRDAEGEPAEAGTIMIRAMGASRTEETTAGDIGRLARELLGESATERPIEPWTLLTDVEDPELLEGLGRLASEVPRAYRERFGLEVSPGERPTDRIVLIDREEDFRQLAGTGVGQALFQAREGPRGNVAVLCGCGLPRRELYSLFVHEAVRLLNRRVFGRALPLWLGEGLAYGLAFGRVDSSGRLDADTLGGREQLVATVPGRARAGGSTTENTGGRLALLHLKQEHDRGRPTKLASLVSSDRAALSDPRARMERIIRSAMFVWFLLDDRNEVLRDGFRTYLRSVAEGGAADEASRPQSPEALPDALGTDWQTLDGRFRRWVDFRARWLYRQGP